MLLREKTELYSGTSFLELIESFVKSKKRILLKIFLLREKICA
jgi:hypothetical protein